MPYNSQFLTCENLSPTGYDLISRDNSGNIIKIQHCLTHRNRNKKMIVDNFFPIEDYKIPNTSNYLNKLPQGETTIRIMTSAVIGYVYFGKDNKPVRSKEAFEERPADMKDDGKISHFWAFVVWNVGEKKIQIMEITQKTIQTPLKALIDNSKWGSPLKYDITINRTGTTMNDTNYAVMPNPHSEMTEEAKKAFENAKIDLEKLFTGDNPFGSK